MRPARPTGGAISAGDGMMATTTKNRRKNATASIPASYSALNIATTEKDYLVREDHQHANPKTHSWPSNRSKTGPIFCRSYSYNYRLIAGALHKARKLPFQNEGLDHKIIQQKKLQANKGARN